jgi:hypothetical protein
MTTIKTTLKFIIVCLLILSSCKKEIYVQEQLPEYIEPDNGEEVYEMPSGSGGNLPLNANLIDHLPPVSNQGNSSICVAMALCALKSIHEQIETGSSFNDEKLYFSPMFIYNQIKISDCKSGAYISDGLKFLKKNGVCEYNKFKELTNCNLLPDQNAYNNALNYKIKDYKRVDGLLISKNEMITNMKYLLSNKQPIITSLTIDEEFKKNEMFSWGSWIWLPNNSKKLTNQYHAVLIVGYDDNLNAFLIMNSYGSAWKNRGFCWVDYQHFANIQRSAFVTFDEIAKTNNGGGSNGSGGNNSSFAEINASISNFGDVLINDSKNNTLVIENTGTNTLTINDIGINHSEYGFGSYYKFPIQILPGNRSYININFSPKNLGLKNCQISIFSNSKSGTRYLNITGNGIQSQTNTSLKSNLPIGNLYGCNNFQSGTWSYLNNSFNVSYGYFSSKVNSIDNNTAQINFSYCNNIYNYSFAKISFMYDYDKNNYWTAYNINDQYDLNQGSSTFNFPLDWWMNTNEQRLRIIPIIAVYNIYGGLIGHFSSPEIIISK